MIKTLLKLIGFGLLLTVLISTFSTIAVICQVGETITILLQIIAFSIAAIVLWFYMEKKGKGFEVFGFRKGFYNPTLIFFMGLIVVIQPIVMGMNSYLSLTTILLIIIEMVLVGFVEESLFRSIFFYFLSKNIKRYIWFSSIVFGILHVASGINPEYPKILVLLQIINALFLGIVFSMIYLKTKSIYSTMVFHSIFNIFASISVDSNINKQIIAVTVLNIIYLFFICYLTKSVVKKY